MPPNASRRMPHVCKIRTATMMKKVRMNSTPMHEEKSAESDNEYKIGPSAKQRPNRSVSSSKEVEWYDSDAFSNFQSEECVWCVKNQNKRPKRTVCRFCVRGCNVLMQSVERRSLFLLRPKDRGEKWGKRQADNAIIKHVN